MINVTNIKFATAHMYIATYVHDPLTSFKRQGAILLVFRFLLRRPKLSFYVRKFHCTSYQSNSADGQIRPSARYYGTLATSRPLWVRAYTVVTFWSSWSISLRDIEPHIYNNSVKIVPRATCLPQFTSATQLRPICSPALHTSHKCCYIYSTDIIYEKCEFLSRPFPLI